jgi:hypothetical protein
LASNPVLTQTPISTIDQVKQILKTVTDAALFIEQLLSGMGVGTDAAQIERLTEAFGNLAAIAVQAAHMVMGREITPDSVMELLPVNTPLAPPADQK